VKRFAALILIFFASQALAIQSVVILPFANQSQDQHIYWLGEAFAESLSEELLLKDAIILQRNQRKSVYEELKLPYTGDLSRATMLKIADKLSADYLVFGSYNLKGTNLESEARVIKLSSAELSDPIKASGTVEDLFKVQMALRDGLSAYFKTKSLEPAEGQAVDDQNVPLHAYELYIKGLLESPGNERVDFLQRALEANPGYRQAALRLGQTLTRLQRYKESNTVLARVTFPGSMDRTARFLTGLNLYYLGDYTGAYQTWLDLSKISPTAEVYNNLGVVLLKQNDLQGSGWYLSKAVEQDLDNADFRFNLASSYVLRKYDKNAVQQYREVIKLQPWDYQAFYLTSKLLEREEDPASKKLYEYFQENVPTDQNGKFPENYTSVVQLLRISSSLLSKEEMEYGDSSEAKSREQRASYVKTYQESARKYLEEQDPGNAIIEIRKGVGLDPFNWYLHYMWGVAFSQQKNNSMALGELDFSIWCQENIESHLLLAEIYRQQERYADAKLQVQRSLALEPNNKKALDIWGRIWDKQ
jgi:tetratricopeptide (TPR) repeat protein